MRTARIALLGSLVLITACGGEEDAEVAIEEPIDAPATVEPAAPAAGGGATATLRDAAGNEVGTVALTEAGQVIQVAGTLRGLPPGTHGFHLHQTGSCEPPSFQSAGGHWNPTNQQHGLENPQGPHYGDLRNIEVGADGTVSVQASTPQGAALRGANGLLDADGAAVVVHAQPDDYRTEPSGSAGDRIACGVVSAS